MSESQEQASAEVAVPERVPRVEAFLSTERQAEIKKPSGVCFTTSPLSDLSESALAIPLALSRYIKGLGWVAGGCFETMLRGAEPKDFDVFLRSSEAMAELLDRVRAKGAIRLGGHSYQLRHFTEEDLAAGRSLTLTAIRGNAPPIQLIRVAWWDSLEQVLDNFDFRVCMMGIEDGQLVHHPEALADFDQRRLVLHRPLTPESLRYRCARYEEKGYSVDASVMAARSAFEAGGGVYDDAHGMS